MEKITSISKKDISIDKGVWTELECCICAHEAKITASNEKELIKAIGDEGWMNLDSDKYQMVGHWCGDCSLKDD